MTIFLPEAIEKMKDRKKLEEKKSLETQLVADVEYDDPDYSEQTNVKLSSSEQREETDENANEFREYSVDLWNGSPFIPHYETLKDDAVKPSQ